MNQTSPNLAGRGKNNIENCGKKLGQNWLVKRKILTSPGIMTLSGRISPAFRPSCYQHFSAIDIVELITIFNSFRHYLIVGYKIKILLFPLIMSFKPDLFTHYQFYPYNLPHYKAKYGMERRITW